MFMEEIEASDRLLLCRLSGKSALGKPPPGKALPSTAQSFLLRLGVIIPWVCYLEYHSLGALLWLPSSE